MIEEKLDEIISLLDELLQIARKNSAEEVVHDSGDLDKHEEIILPPTPPKEFNRLNKGKPIFSFKRSVELQPMLEPIRRKED